MKSWKRITLLATIWAAGLLPMQAQKRTYDAVAADVPFKFTVGDRTFHPGHYQLVLMGVNLVALRDDKKQVVAQFVTRSVDTAEPEATSHLVFKTRGKTHELDRICLQSRTQDVQIVGEMGSQLLPGIEPVFFGRPGPRFKQ